MFPISTIHTVKQNWKMIMISKKRRNLEQNHNLFEHPIPAFTGINGIEQKRKNSAPVRHQTLIPHSTQPQYVHSVFLEVHSVVCWFNYNLNKNKFLCLFTQIYYIFYYTVKTTCFIIHRTMLDHLAHKSSTMD